jgi:hypothetical protein
MFLFLPAAAIDKAGRRRQLHCKLVSDAQNLQCWLNDKHDHWRSIRRGGQVQILYRNSNPADMRLLSDFDFRPLAGILYCVFGLLLSACGGIPLAAPIFVWLRQRLGIVDVSPTGPPSQSE